MNEPIVRYIAGDIALYHLPSNPPALSNSLVTHFQTFRGAMLLFQGTPNLLPTSNARLLTTRSHVFNTVHIPLAT